MSRQLCCPACQAPALIVAQTLELPGDATWDEITLQTLHCAQCGWHGLGTYTESRRGALDSECWEHWAYEIPRTNQEGLEALIDRCPRPMDKDCLCLTHLALGQTDLRGYWQGLEALEPSQPFALPLS